MQLIFSSIDANNQYREFTWWFTSLEVIYDVLNSIVAKGSQLIQAELVDNGQRTQLPIEAFDGTLCSAPIRQLEEDWKQLLSDPVDQRLLHNQHPIDFITQKNQGS